MVNNIFSMAITNKQQNLHIEMAEKCWVVNFLTSITPIRLLTELLKLTSQAQLFITYISLISHTSHTYLTIDDAAKFFIELQGNVQRLLGADYIQRSYCRHLVFVVLRHQVTHYNICCKRAVYFIALVTLPASGHSLQLLQYFGE